MSHDCFVIPSFNSGSCLWIAAKKHLPLIWQAEQVSARSDYISLLYKVVIYLSTFAQALYNQKWPLPWARVATLESIPLHDMECCLSSAGVLHVYSCLWWSWRSLSPSQGGCGSYSGSEVTPQNPGGSTGCREPCGHSCTWETRPRGGSPCIPAAPGRLGWYATRPRWWDTGLRICLGIAPWTPAPPLSGRWHTGAPTRPGLHHRVGRPTAQPRTPHASSSGPGSSVGPEVFLQSDGRPQRIWIGSGDAWPDIGTLSQSCKTKR